MLTRFDIVFAKLLPLGGLRRNPPLRTSNVYIKVTMYHVRMDLPASTKVKTKVEIIPTKNLNKKSHMVYIYIYMI